MNNGDDMKKENGFTLVELLAVIVILAIIMIIAIPSVLSTMTTAKQSSFCEYFEKVYLQSQKIYMEKELGEVPNGSLILDISSDLGLDSTGTYAGYVIISKGYGWDGWTNKIVTSNSNEVFYEINLWNEEYYIGLLVNEYGLPDSSTKLTFSSDGKEYNVLEPESDIDQEVQFMTNGNGQKIIVERLASWRYFCHTNYDSEKYTQIANDISSSSIYYYDVNNNLITPSTEFLSTFEEFVNS